MRPNLNFNPICKCLNVGKSDCFHTCKEIRRWECLHHCFALVLFECWVHCLQLYTAQMVESACNASLTGFDPWVGKISWRREWLPIPVLLDGEFHGQRSLVYYSPWGRKEADMTEWLLLSLFLFQMVNRLPTTWESQVWSLGRKDPLEKEMTTHFSTLAWKIPWTEEPGRLESMGLQSVGRD